MLNTFQSLVLIAVIFIILFGISLFWTKTIKTKINKKNNSLIRNYMGFIYLVFGFLLWVGVKLFSSKPAAYRFATCVFKWPKIFGPLIRAL